MISRFKLPGFSGLLRAAALLSFIVFLGGIQKAAASPPPPDPDSEETWRLRMQSADQLLHDAGQVAAHGARVCQMLDGVVRKDSSAASSMDQYASLFREYEKALSTYTSHRKQYFEHCRRFHSSGQSQYLSPPSKASLKSMMPAGRPLKLAVQQRCRQLMMVEADLRNKEQRLGQLVTQLMIARSDESQDVLASLWSEAEGLARNAQGEIATFNHLGIQKTCSASSSVHDMIAEANRDGNYRMHVKAFQALSSSNSLQSEIFASANRHSQFVMMMITRLASLRPSGMDMGDGDSPGYSQEELLEESSELNDEYERLQKLSRKLEEVRRSLPPTPEKKGHI